MADRKFSFGTLTKNIAKSAGTTAFETAKGAFMTTPTAMGVRATLGTVRNLKEMAIFPNNLS